MKMNMAQFIDLMCNRPLVYLEAKSLSKLQVALIGFRANCEPEDVEFWESLNEWMSFKHRRGITARNCISILIHDFGDTEESFNKFVSYWEEFKKREEFNKRKTDRGLSIVEFVDRNEHKCSVQNSSAASEACIWLGVNNDSVDPQTFVANKGWTRVEVPADTLYHSRMHLNQEQVKKLIPFLQNFIETGSI